MAAPVLADALLTDAPAARRRGETGPGELADGAPPLGDTPAAGASPRSVAAHITEQAARHGDRPYLLDARQETAISFADLAEALARLASPTADKWPATAGQALAGERVGLCVGEPLTCAVTLLGLLASGCTVMPLDPRATDSELSTTLSRLAPSVVVADRPAPEGSALPWAETGSHPRPGVPFGAFGALVAPGTPRGRGEVAPPPPLRASPGDGASAEPGSILLSTSGTTGPAKQIRLVEAQLLHVAEAVAGHHALGPDDRCFNPLPLFHINAPVVALLASLVAGGSVVLDDRFHRRDIWAVMERHDVSWLNAVPAVVSRLIPLREGERPSPSLRFVRSASAPLPAPLLDAFHRCTGVPVVESYGMTEAASQITATPLAGAPKPGSAGRPVRTELRVVAEPTSDEEPRRAAPGEVGGVEIRGPGVITSYAGDEAGGHHAQRFRHGGWLATGDRGYLDHDGDLFLVGRDDDMINRSGEKIAPREVEEVILAHPQVAEVAVAGEADSVFGQVPVAYVVLQTTPTTTAGAAPTLKALGERCAKELSRPKRPVRFHMVEALPAGATGKVLRRALAEELPLFTVAAG